MQSTSIVATSRLTIDACCIDVDSEAVAWTVCDLAIDAFRIDVEALPVTIDEGSIECGNCVGAIDDRSSMVT